VTGSSAVWEMRTAPAAPTRRKQANTLIYNSASKAWRSLRRWKLRDGAQQSGG